MQTPTLSTSGEGSRERRPSQFVAEIDFAEQSSSAEGALHTLNERVSRATELLKKLEASSVSVGDPVLGELGEGTLQHRIRRQTARPESKRDAARVWRRVAAEGALDPADPEATLLRVGGLERTLRDLGGENPTAKANEGEGPAYTDSVERILERAQSQLDWKVPHLRFYFRTEFSLDDVQAAYKDAVQAAHQQAELLARASGQTLGLRRTLGTSHHRLRRTTEHHDEMSGTAWPAPRTPFEVVTKSLEPAAFRVSVNATYFLEDPTPTAPENR